MMNWKRIIIAAIVFAIIAQVIHTVESMLTMDFYMDEAYLGVWSKLMMPVAGPPPAEFFYVSIVSGVIIALIYAAVYDLVNNSLSGKTTIKKGLQYGIILFLMVQIPGLLAMYLLVNLPAMLLVYWGISSLVISLIGGIVIAKIVK
ncbi:MAG: hypothetical protein ABIE55_00125 [Candidatus Aenigmatarchaeota archaeon]